MKVEITGEMRRKALDAYGRLEDVLEAVAPLIADMALERAAELVSDDHDRHSTDYLAAAIRALKEPTP